MAIIRCNNGHYYDDKKFAQCPHCGVLPVMNGNTEPKAEKKAGHFSFFSKIRKPAPETPVYEEDDDKTIALEDDDKTIALEDNDKTIALEDDDRTIALEEQESFALPQEPDVEVTMEPAQAEEPEAEDEDLTPVEEEPVQEAQPPVEEEPIEEEQPEAEEEPVQEEAPQAEEEPVQEEELPHVEEESVQEALPQAEEEPVQEKQSPVEEPIEEEEQEAEPEDYVVGWLVCTTGQDKGRDYRLYRGFNRIVLRKNRVRLVLQTEEQDQVAGAVVYDDSSNHFFLMPQQDEICLNGEVIAEALEIRSGDEITAEGENFVFVAFCTEERRWDADSETE